METRVQDWNSNQKYVQELLDDKFGIFVWFLSVVLYGTVIDMKISLG